MAPIETLTDMVSLGHCDACNREFEAFDEIGYLGAVGPHDDSVECTPMTLLRQYCVVCARERGFPTRHDVRR